MMSVEKYSTKSSPQKTPIFYRYFSRFMINCCCHFDSFPGRSEEESGVRTGFLLLCRYYWSADDIHNSTLTLVASYGFVKGVISMTVILLVVGVCGTETQCARFLLLTRVKNTVQRPEGSSPSRPTIGSPSGGLLFDMAWAA